MQYKSEERYIFSWPNEKEALRFFKDELRESSIPFEEEGGAFRVTVIIRTNGTFDMSKKVEVTK